MDIIRDQLTDHYVTAFLHYHSNKTAEVARQLFDFVIDHLNQKPLKISEPRWVWGRLYVNCFLTSESAHLLVGSRRLWDCEMLLRSVFEGTVRLLNLTTGTPEEHTKRAEEYWMMLPEIDRLKKSMIA